MAGERQLRILSLLTSGGVDVTTARLCEVSAEVTAVSGAGVMLMPGDTAQGSLCTTDEVSALIEQLQFALGEGPCLDAFHHDRPVLEPDLVHPVTARWLAFSSPAIEAGVRGIFGFPLRVGAVRLGALNLYCDQPTMLTDEQHADALVMADVVAQVVLALQADAPPGKLAVALETGADFQYVVHQASGMVAAQLDVSVGHALIQLKAYAFGNGRPLDEVAEDVVSRKLRFDASGGKTGTAP
jgi:GAF domain